MSPTSQPIIGYIRVSTDEQSLSVEAQQHAIAQWCQAHQATLIATYEDIGVSGGTPIEKRPGLLSALSALTRGSALLVVRRDRLARETLTALMCEQIATKAGARICTVTGEGNGDGPEAELLRTILYAFAKYEKALIAVRTKAGLQRERTKGERVGMLPHGKRLDVDGVHFIDDLPEQAVIASVRQLRASGLSYRGIVAELNRQGLTNRAEGHFQVTQIVRMLEAV